MPTAILSVAQEAFIYILWYFATGLAHALVISKFILDKRTHHTTGWGWFVVHGLGCAAAAVAAFMRAMIMQTPPTVATDANYDTWIALVSFSMLQVAALTAWVVATGKLHTKHRASDTTEVRERNVAGVDVTVVSSVHQHDTVYLHYGILSFVLVAVAFACSIVEMSLAFVLTYPISSSTAPVLTSVIPAYGLLPYTVFHLFLFGMVAARKFGKPMWTYDGATANYGEGTRRFLGKRSPTVALQV